MPFFWNTVFIGSTGIIRRRRRVIDFPSHRPNCKYIVRLTVPSHRLSCRHIVEVWWIHFLSFYAVCVTMPCFSCECDDDGWSWSLIILYQLCAAYRPTHPLYARASSWICFRVVRSSVGLALTQQLLKWTQHDSVECAGERDIGLSVY